jgi:uncharacterized membrane protein
MTPDSNSEISGLRRETQARSFFVWDFTRVWPLWKFLLGPGLTLMVGSVMAQLYFTSLRPPADRIVDFYQERASARNYREGLRLYTNHRVTIPRYLSLAVSRPDELTVEVNAHPPTSVLLALPFAFLGYQDAVLVWNLASLLLLLVSLFLVWRGLKIPVSPWWIFPLITSLLVCNPLILQVFFAQLDLLLLVLLTGTWAANRSGRPILAGVLLGAATALKLFPGLIFIYFLMRRQWKVAFVGALAVISLTALTVAVFGLEPYRDYYTEALPKVAEFRSNWINASLLGFWVKLFDPAVNDWQVEPLWQSALVARLGTMICCAGLLIALAVCVRRAETTIEKDLAYGLSLIAMLLISPIAWDHYLLLLLVPIVATWATLPPSMGARVLFAAILVAFWSPPSVIHELMIPGGKSQGVAKPWATITLLSYQCYALIAFFILGASSLVRETRARSAREAGL